MAYALRPKNGRAEDVLFWQESIGEALPGNMKVAMKMPHRNIRIAVQDNHAREEKGNSAGTYQRATR